MKPILVIIMFLKTMAAVFAQDTIVDIIQTRTDVFKVGDMYYAPNYVGLKNLMIDIRAEDLELYERLLPAYQQIKHKRSIKLATSYSIATVGAALMIGSFTFWQRKEVVTNYKIRGGFWATMEPASEEQKRFNVFLFIGGKLLFIGGMVGSRFAGSGESDFYNFINIHNKYSPKRKMQWKIGLNFNPAETFRLACRF